MGTLTGCMAKAGKALSPQDRKAILEHAEELRKGGMDAPRAAIAAVDKRIAHVQAQPARSGGSLNALISAAKQFAEGLVASRKVRALKPGQRLACVSRGG